MGSDSIRACWCTATAWCTRLVDKGWRIYRYTEYEIHREQQRILDEVGRALERVR
ncbi:hypothetical protein [Pseudonocardia sp. 73-21]|uniref:hypothetical protein n=1 Tax=Pseudonocardia sp. 73-21 TaxID=1895809 RepID=UPI000A518FCE|nr:hypothetical protein [Pseudonocardia sp. 73-21]